MSRFKGAVSLAPNNWLDVGVPDTGNPMQAPQPVDLWGQTAGGVWVRLLLGADGSLVPGTGAAGLGKAEDSVHASGDVGVMLLAVRKDTAAALSADADYHVLEVNSTGGLYVSEQSMPGYEDGSALVAGVLQKPVSSATYAPSRDVDFGTVIAKSVKGSAGNVYAICVENRNAVVRYFQLHNKATIPLSTEVPILSIPIPAGTTNNPGMLILDSAWFAPSERFATGIGWAISTTLATYTAATANEHSVSMRYA